MGPHTQIAFRAVPGHDHVQVAAVQGAHAVGALALALQRDQRGREAGCESWLKSIIIFAGTGPTENSQQRLDFAILPFPFAGLPPTTSIHATNVSQRVPGRDRARRVVAGGRRGTGGARWSDPGVVVVSRRCKARWTRQRESALRTGTKGGEVAPVQG